MQYPVALCGRVVFGCSSLSIPFVFFVADPNHGIPQMYFVWLYYSINIEENLQNCNCVVCSWTENFWTSLVRSIWLINIYFLDKYPSSLFQIYPKVNYVHQSYYVSKHNWHLSKTKLCQSYCASKHNCSLSRTKCCVSKLLCFKGTKP